jgi:hypothetical protein
MVHPLSRRTEGNCHKSDKDPGASHPVPPYPPLAGSHSDRAEEFALPVNVPFHVEITIFGLMV